MLEVVAPEHHFLFPGQEMIPSYFIILFNFLHFERDTTLHFSKSEAIPSPEDSMCRA
jgi:hypothetical protein